MPQQRAPQPRVKIRLHKRFYVFAGLLALLLIWIVYGAVKPTSHVLQTELKTPACVVSPSTPPPCAPKTLTAYSYPFASAQEEAKFQSVAQPIQNNESFYENYTGNKGLPITFIAYILPKGSKYAADEYTDGSNIYLPAAFITPGEPNAVSSIAQSSNNGESSTPPILLGFSKSKAYPAQGSFVRVYGTIWWQSAYARPEDTLTGAVPTDLPIILAGNYSLYSDIEAEYPATQTQALNIDIQRGTAEKSYSLSIQNIEYNSTQTRIFVTVTNNTNVQLGGWNGGSATTLNNSGSTISCGSQGSSESGADAFSDAEFAPRATLSGFIVCGATNPSEKTEVYLPDLPVAPENTSSSSRNQVNKIVITVPPQS